MATLVSVIMPTCDRLQFLGPALESLFAQTCSDWELIIADDGSAAPTRDYLRGLLARPQVQVIWLAHSGRPAVARNRALQAARGSYVAFLDSDDLWLPHKLERQLASLRQHPERKWGYTAFGIVDAAGRPRTTRTMASLRPAISGWIAQQLLSEETIIALPSVVVERECLERVGVFDEQLVMCEDDELWLRLALHSEVDALDEPLTLVRRHGQHHGDDVTAWSDRRRVFERALRTNADPRLRASLRRLRAAMSAGLANSEVGAGRRMRALGTLLASARYSWRYRRWWATAAGTVLRACAPRKLRGLLRRCRHGFGVGSP
jgi:glycosyltransferase involved in cell wall biosynthesis